MVKLNPVARRSGSHHRNLSDRNGTGVAPEKVGGGDYKVSAVARCDRDGPGDDVAVNIGVRKDSAKRGYRRTREHDDERVICLICRQRADVRVKTTHRRSGPAEAICSRRSPSELGAVERISESKGAEVFQIPGRPEAREEGSLRGVDSALCGGGRNETRQGHSRGKCLNTKNVLFHCERNITPKLGNKKKSNGSVTFLSRNLLPFAGAEIRAGNLQKAA